MAIYMHYSHVLSLPHHTTPVDTYPETLILHASTPTQTQSLSFTLCTERFVYVAADHFGFTILFRCNFLRVFISFFTVHVFTLTPPALSLSLTLFKLAIFFGFIFLFFSCYRWQRLSAALSAATLSSTINC